MKEFLQGFIELDGGRKFESFNSYSIFCEIYINPMLIVKNIKVTRNQVACEA